MILSSWSTVSKKTLRSGVLVISPSIGTCSDSATVFISTVLFDVTFNDPLPAPTCLYFGPAWAPAFNPNELNALVNASAALLGLSDSFPVLSSFTNNEFTSKLVFVSPASAKYPAMATLISFDVAPPTANAVAF